MAETKLVAIVRFCVPAQDGGAEQIYTVQFLREGWLTGAGIQNSPEAAIRFRGARGIEFLVAELRRLEQLKRFKVKILVAPPEIREAFNRTVA